MTTTQTPTKPRYRTPRASCYVNVSLDEFDNSDLVAYLKNEGYQVNGKSEAQGCESAKVDGMYISPDDLSHIDTLAVCGQLEQARKMALDIVGEAIGRPL